MIISEIKNDERVRERINAWRGIQEIADHYVEKAAKAKAEVKEVVKELGGYEKEGFKAYFEERESYDYDIMKLGELCPAWVLTAVTEKVINKPKLEALTKGGLVTEATLSECRVITKKVEAFVCPMPKAEGVKGNDIRD